MTTYILQYEIQFRVEFLNLSHDLLFYIMTQLTSYDPICTFNLNMSSQCQVISHLHVMTYLLDSQNALDS